MNEKIKELAEQAVTRFDQDMDGSMEPEELGQWVRVGDLDKFAELIVKECASRVDNILRERKDGGGTMGDEIREHFGVAE